MRRLFDTQAFVWYLTEDRRLPDEVRRLIDDPNEEGVASIASLWELTIKISLGKFKLFDRIEDIVDDLIDCGFTFLPIELQHLYELSKLPHHHRDPFDRLLIAQSFCEQLPLVSSDPAFDLYGIERVF